MDLPETLERLAGSVGATRLRPGFALNPDLDLLWACGFPDLVYLVDESPKKGPAKWFRDREPLRLPVALPAEVAHLLVNAADHATRDCLSAKPGEARSKTDALLAQAEALPAPGEEARLRVLRKLLGDGHLFFGEPRSNRLLWVLESLGGPEWLMSSALEILESFSPEALNEANAHRVGTVNRLRPVLWRLPARAREDALRRFGALFEAAKEAWPYGPFARKPKIAGTQHVITTLDAIVHGVEAVIAYRVQNPWVVALTQDPGFLGGFFTATKGEKWTAIGAAAAFVAPDAVLNAYTVGWGEYTQKNDQLELVESLGTLADDRILPWMMEMSAGSKVKGDAKKWFVANAEIAGTFVQGLASEESHPFNAWAKKMGKALKL